MTETGQNVAASLKEMFLKRKKNKLTAKILQQIARKKKLKIDIQDELLTAARKIKKILEEQAKLSKK